MVRAIVAVITAVGVLIGSAFGVKDAVDGLKIAIKAKKSMKG